ncbi:MAG: BrnT family toxin [Chloroflexi bacterium]|nr:BrnT family toxin [Chloroflexota bacterium]
MKFRDVIWLEEVEEKIFRKHRVVPDEAEETLVNNPHIRLMERGYQPGEDLYAAFGQTDSDRYLAVFFINKGEGVALIITARDMTQKEIRRYGKKRGK